MNPIARGLITAGLVLILLGIAWQWGGRFLHLGRLPGDIAIERPGFKFYFPLATSLLLSLVLSLLMLLFRRLGK